MKTIIQYEIQNAKIGVIQPVRMPIHSQILSTLSSGTSIILNALVPDDVAVTELRHFILYAPGAELPADEGNYIGTIQFSKTILFLFELAGTNILMKDDGTSQLLKDDLTSNLRKDTFI